MINLPSLPSIDPGINKLNPQLWNVLSAVKSNLDTLRSLPDTVTANKTAMETAIANVVTEVNTAISNISTTITNSTVDTSTPNAIDNLTVTSGVMYNFLEWGAIPGITDHVAIYRATTDDRTSATIIGSSQYTIYSDYIPDGVGTNYYYWIRAVSTAGVLGDWNLIGGVVSAAGTSASPVGIGDNQVASLSATKIICSALSAFTANLGEVNAGIIRSPDNTFIIDLTDQSITIAGPNGVAADDYTLIKNGVITFQKWTGATHQTGSALQTIESGTASSGDTITLSKWYAEMPDIIPFLSKTPVYDKRYPDQNQTLEFQVTNKNITSGGVVSFDAVVNLILSDGLVTHVVNQTSGTRTTDAAYSGTAITTEANVTGITCDLTIQSYRGTGTVPNYYKRKVSIRIAYRVSGSGSYSFTSATAYNLPYDLATHTTQVSVTGLSSNTYDFYIEVTPSDYGGTFTSGSVTYDYHNKTINLASDSSLFSVSGYGYYTATASIAMPSYTADSGYESYSIYQVVYTISYGYCAQSSGTHSGAIVQNSKVTIDAEGGNHLGTYGVPSASSTYTLTTTSYTTSPEGLNLIASGYGSPINEYALAQAKFFSAGTNALVKTRKAQANSSTPSNIFILNDYICTLSASSAIGNGSMKYVAIGK